VKSFVAGAALAAVRLRRGATLAALIAAALLVAFAALVERRLGPAAAADRTLVGAVFGLALPLLGYLALYTVTEAGRLDNALAVIARHGGQRKLAALGLVGACALALAAAGATLAALGVVLARGTADPRLARDLLASSWVGVLGGASYAAWFGLGSTVGRRGGGRVWALFIDWVLGSSATLLAVAGPRGHLRNLLGAEPVLGMPQWAGLAVLVALGVAYVALTLWRLPA
jgi:hypothetical protein